MPDWKPQIRKRIAKLNLAAPREVVPLIRLARFPAAQAWLDSHPRGSQASQ